VLTVTNEATTAIRTLVHGRDLPDSAGLRLAAAGESTGRFTAAVVDEPTSGDEVVDVRGTHVYLDAEAASALDDRILDARVTPNGGFRFALKEE
jgi:Fe-S cluster assembly iron-binding protein IscA